MRQGYTPCKGASILHILHNTYTFHFRVAKTPTDMETVAWRWGQDKKQSLGKVKFKFFFLCHSDNPGI